MIPPLSLSHIKFLQGGNQTNSATMSSPFGDDGRTPNIGGFGGLGGLGGSGGLGGLSGMEQMMGGMPDAIAMSQLMQNPAISQMMQSMLSNPQFMNQIMNLNPQLRVVVDVNPQFRKMMQKPELLRQLTNPKPMQQMLALQQSLFTRTNRQPTQWIVAGVVIDHFFCDCAMDSFSIQNSPLFIFIFQ